MGWNLQGCASVLLLGTTLALGVSAETVHVLAVGETLYSLARQYDIDLDKLLRANNVSDPSALGVGTRIVIPDMDESVTAGNFHTVAKGDTYYGIARQYGLSVDKLLTINGRTSSRILRVGETLVVTHDGIPSTKTPAVEIIPSRMTKTERISESDVPWWPVSGIRRPLDGKLVGISIEAQPMSYVQAVTSGDVVWTGPYRGFGHVVLIDSGGYIYLYGGNQDLFVNVGQRVSVGSRIGRLGSSGPTGENQKLIFSVFREGLPVSPDDAPRG